jgi:hypothetical protein
MAANPNTLSDSFPEYWSRRMQRKHYKTDRYREIVSMEEQDTLERGDKVTRPKRSALTVNDLGADGAYTRQAITDTAESLTIDKEKEVSFYIRKIDEMQSNYRTANEYADDAAVLLGNLIDGEVLGESLNATSDVDDGDLGATDENGITLTTSNIDKVFGEAAEALDALDVDMDDRWAVISPQFYNVLWQRIGGRESMLGDEAGRNGVRGQSGKWAGFRLIRSNANVWTGVLGCATIATDTDTVTINGVVFTADGDGAAVGAGHWSIQASADLCWAQFADAVNNGQGYAASVGAVDTYIEVTAADRAKLKGVTAVHSTSADTVTITAKGRSYFAVSEALTDGTDTWTAAKQIQHNLFGQGKPIDLVIQKRPNMVTKDRDGYLGKDVVSWTVFGKKTFTEGADQMVDVCIRTDAF